MVNMIITTQIMQRYLSYAVAMKLKKKVRSEPLLSFEDAIASGATVNQFGFQVLCDREAQTGPMGDFTERYIDPALVALRLPADARLVYPPARKSVSELNISQERSRVVEAYNPALDVAIWHFDVWWCVPLVDE